MDLVAGVRRVIVTMEHTAKNGAPKIKSVCELPLTGKAVVDLVITDLCVLQRLEGNALFSLVEIAPGITADEVRAKTAAKILI